MSRDALSLNPDLRAHAGPAANAERMSAVNADQISERPAGFWKRQFSERPTRAQNFFDVSVGILLPVACLALDPIVFRSGGWGVGPVLGAFKLFAYALIALEITALAAWLALSGQAGAWCGALGGAMTAGALFSLVVGVVLLPLTLMGLIFLIGVLGFSPFVVAFVYWRNGRRARRESARFLTEGQRKRLPLVAALLALALPAWAQLEVSRLVARSLPDLTGADARRAKSAADTLELVGLIAEVDLDPLVREYAKETDAARKERLAFAYIVVNGGHIEDRLMTLMD